MSIIHKPLLELSTAMIGIYRAAKQVSVLLNEGEIPRSLEKSPLYLYVVINREKGARRLGGPVQGRFDAA
ncbi:hypothetical protein PMI04_012330 [Sphingobium sp. AP49]|uniref:hypothetical protein n=1 Tax=Sphingobium sp. AP49 TaxID=1144307 RepID=UPI0012F6E8E6|nr:hypothetical protein [Sphingobium sp. AP49]WHO37358.1 hypothetical protein PMI04_012330 [Sphingobium sp. AP49]